MALVLCVLVAGAVLVTWPLATCPGSCLPANLGDPLLNTWIVGWGSQRLLDGLRGFWDAPIFHPYEGALGHSEHLLGITFLVAPVYWATGNAVLTYNAAFFLAFVLAGGGVYTLVRTLTGRRDVALAVGCVFMCTPYLGVSQVSRLQVLYCGWMGFALSALHHYFEHGARARLVGFVASTVMVSISNTYYAVYFAVPAGCLAAWGVWRDRAHWRAHLVNLGAAAGAIAVLLAPIGLRYQAVQADRSIERSTAEVDRYSANIYSYGHVWHTSTLARWLPAEVTSEQALFPGVVLLALTVLVAWQAWRHASRSLANAYAAVLSVAFVLSLGPVVRAGDVVVSERGPYYWLMTVVPGIDALRAPARMGILVTLALCVLVALGLARATATLGAGKRAFVAAFIGVLAVAESLAHPVPLVPFAAGGRRQDQAVNEWLARQDPGPVLALPIGLENFNVVPRGGETLALHYQFSTLHHGQPLVNGSSGFHPPLTAWLEGPGSPFGEMPASLPFIVDMLQSLGVRYVVVHTDDFKSEALATAVVAGLGELTHAVTPRGHFGPKHVFEVATLASPTQRGLDGGTPIPAFDLASSHASEATEALVDRQSTTRWRSGDEQNGDEWLRVQFTRPTPVSSVSLVLGTLGMQEYPRGLRVWAERDGERHKLFDDHVLDLLAAALLTDPSRVAVSVPLGGTVADALHIEQTGRSPWPWSVDEIEVRSP